ncbi:XRE family transcriptional regulator [Bifidobacterium indicum]|nr:XRE family transcriptional regulator [Bifidobacterium indicum]
MTVRRRDKPTNPADIPVMTKIGRVVKQHRKDLTDIKPSTRQSFILAAIDLGLPDNWITEKSLSNIENGLNMPSLRTLYNLSIALQIDATDLFIEISQAFLDTVRQSSSKG